MNATAVRSKIRHLAPAMYDALLNRLSQLFPGTPSTVSLSTVARDAGLDVSKIHFFADAYSVWDAILSRAEVEDKIEDLLKKVHEFYEEDDLINKAISGAESGEAYITPTVSAEDQVVKRGLQSPGKLKVFVNYNRNDAAYKEKLINFTLPYIRFPEPLPVAFFDVVDDILAGSDRMEKAREELGSSDLVLLLLSNDFLLKENGFCYDLTLTAKELGKILAPIKVRPAPIERIKLIASLKMLPEDEPPLANRDEDTYDETAHEIFNLIEDLLKSL